MSCDDVGYQPYRHNGTDASSDFFADMGFLRVKGTDIPFGRSTVDRLRQVLLGFFGDGRTCGCWKSKPTNNTAFFIYLSSLC